MEFKENVKEIIIILISAIILGAVWLYPKNIANFWLLSIFFLIIIVLNILAKKYVAYKFEINLRANSSFKKIELFSKNHNIVQKLFLVAATFILCCDKLENLSSFSVE